MSARSPRYTSERYVRTEPAVSGAALNARLASPATSYAKMVAAQPEAKVMARQRRAAVSGWPSAPTVAKLVGRMTDHAQSRMRKRGIGTADLLVFALDVAARAVFVVPCAGKHRNVLYAQCVGRFITLLMSGAGAIISLWRNQGRSQRLRYALRSVDAPLSRVPPAVLAALR